MLETSFFELRLNGRLACFNQPIEAGSETD
jgi:hypothetical protein